MMNRAKIFTLTLFAATLLLSDVPKMQGQHLFPPPRPLCVSQFALANYACSLLPFTPQPPPRPPTPPPPSPPDDDEGHKLQQDNDNDNDRDHDDGNDNNHERRHGHEHGHGHGHRHRHGHHRHLADPTPAEANCCRWLNQMDNECVCELLVHLPVFLLKPAHAYTITVRDVCTVTYECGTSLKIRV